MTANDLTVHKARVMVKKPSATEVDSYIFIKESLKALGWDVRNPERVDSGQVYTQNECLSNPEIKLCLNLDRPENIVKINETVLWVIEAKRSHSQLEQALSEAKGYADKLNQSSRFKVLFVSGVAGNEHDSFLVETHFLTDNNFIPVTINDIKITGLLSPDQATTILETKQPNIDNIKIDEKLFVSTAERINEILHLGVVNAHQRAGVMAALLLSTLSSTSPNLEGSPLVLIKDINARVEEVLQRQGKREFINDVTIPLPGTTDNHIKLRKALVDTLQELNALNIRSAMRSGDDWLGAFYEVFLKYAVWAQDLGIVLTPRHITKFVADTMDIQANDIIYDPTCGTGGFLVAALDYVKQNADESQLSRFKQYSVFGIEQDSGVAALAVVNMIFRGDGKNNIHEGNCFVKNLDLQTVNGTSTARYTSESPKNPPVSKIMMNPPFALKRSDEKEFKFINHALEQTQHGGILFSVLPYSSMVRPGIYQTWRKEQLLKKNTLLAVITFPSDLFYPVGVTTVGIFIKKGVPHSPTQNVLWIRALEDGFVKSKGKRLPSSKVNNDLEKVRDVVKAFVRNPSFTVPSILQFQQAKPVDFADNLLELVPEAYLDQAEPAHHQIAEGLEDSLRAVFAYLVKINKAVIKSEFLTEPPHVTISQPHKWGKLTAAELFQLNRGHFHSIAALDEGVYPTISRVSTDNGFVGFYDLPQNANVIPAKTITVSTVAGDAFVQPVPFIATDNVVLCRLKPKYADVSLASLYFISFMLNLVKWRYSYGRQCYKTKFAKTEIPLPLTETGTLDDMYMRSMVENTRYWSFIKAVHDLVDTD